MLSLPITLALIAASSMWMWGTYLLNHMQSTSAATVCMNGMRILKPYATYSCSWGQCCRVESLPCQFSISCSASNWIPQNCSHAGTSRLCGLLGEPEKVVAIAALVEELLISKQGVWLSKTNLALDMLADIECE